MAKTYDEYKAKVAATIQDDAAILNTTTEVPLFIQEAVSIYSKDRPLEKIHEDDGDGKYEYDLPNDWDKDFSAIISRIEYPDENYQTPQFVDDNEWIIYKSKDGGRKLRFLTISPQSGYGFRYTYILLHTLSDEDNTVPDIDFDALCDLAASLCCRALAAKYAQSEAPTIDADVIDYARKADDYSRLAELLEQRYNVHMGKGLPKEALEKPGAQAIKDMDIEFMHREDYFSHPKRLR